MDNYYEDLLQEIVNDILLKAVHLPFKLVIEEIGSLFSAKLIEDETTVIKEWVEQGKTREQNCREIIFDLARGGMSRMVR